MFQNQLNPNTLISDRINDRALVNAQLQPGRVGVYSASQAGGRLGTRIGGMMGLQTPEAVNQQNLQAILQKYPKMETPEQMLAAANDLRGAGYLEFAQKMTDNATNLRNSQTTQTKTTYMQDLRDIAQFQLACDFNDPECAKKAQEIWKDQKRAGAEEKGAGKLSEELSKSLVNSFDESNANASSARYYRETIDQSLGFLDDDLYTGPGAETINYFRNLGVGLGLGFVDPGKAAKTEQFRVNSMNSIMAWVQKTKGAISEAEMRLFGSASEGLARTRGGNRLILLTARGIAEYQIRLDDEFTSWMETTKEPTQIKWKAHLREWNKENGNMLPSKEEIAAALAEEPLSESSIVVDKDEIVIEAIN